MSPAAQPGTSAPGRPAWVDDRLFPFTSRWEQIDGHHLHHVDEGTGPTLLMLHGNPTWSFLFRHLVRALRPAFRCIALDYPGFGLSQPAPGYRYRPQDHAELVRRFVAHKDLTDVTVFVQDWGGPIGLWAAARDPDRYRGFVIGNTRAWPPLTGTERRGSAVLGGALGSLLVERLDVMVRGLAPRLAVRRPLTADERRHYTAPLPGPADRRPVRTLVRSITREPEFLTDVRDGLPALAHLPALILWAESDRGFPVENRLAFERAFPLHHSVTLRGTGHFLWQDAPDLVIREFRRWWMLHDPIETR